MSHDWSTGLPTALHAVIFDFDHTLAHLGDEVDWERALAALIAVYRRWAVAPQFLDGQDSAIDLYGAVSRDGLLPPAALPAAQEEAARTLEQFEAAAALRIRCLPEAIVSVRRLRASGMGAAVVSSNAHRVVADVLARDGLADAVEVIIGREDVRETKPSPEGLLRCCEQLGMEPARCLYAGDSVSDVVAAREAGMPAIGLSIGVSFPDELRQAGAIAVVDGVDELARVIIARRTT